MSQANAAADGQPPQLETLETVSALMKSQKKLLLINLGLGAIALLCAIAAIVLGSMGSGEESAELNPNDARIEHLDEEVADLLNQVEIRTSVAEQTHTELSELSTQVGRIDINDERNAVIRLQRLMVKQEQDFQTFLTTLESGLYNFHMMVPHSRGWWDEYKADLDSAKELSKAREEYATNLHNN
ncbi:MAG: hypothetical protein ACSHXZ_00105 [Gammaproteobacteria bacterium]